MNSSFLIGLIILFKIIQFYTDRKSAAAIANHQTSNKTILKTAEDIEHDISPNKNSPKGIKEHKHKNVDVGVRLTDQNNDIENVKNKTNPDSVMEINKNRTLGYGTIKERRFHHISMDNSINALDNIMHIGDGVPGVYSKYIKKLPEIDFSKQVGRPSIINKKDNPHEMRFTTFDKFPEILSNNRRSLTLVKLGHEPDKNAKRLMMPTGEMINTSKVKQAKKFKIYHFKKKDLL